ncbi:Parp12, partial [Symbiodinium necroappetens]
EEVNFEVQEPAEASRGMKRSDGPSSEAYVAPLKCPRSAMQQLAEMRPKASATAWQRPGKSSAGGETTWALKELAEVRQKLVAAEEALCQEKSLRTNLQEKQDLEEKQVQKLQASLQEQQEQLREQQCLANEKLQQLQAQLNAENMRRICAEEQLKKLRPLTNSVNHGAFWQYELDGCWHAFTPEGSEQMHRAYEAYLVDGQRCCTATIVAGGVARLVDFRRMTQQHAITKKVRKIRIRMGVPAQWESGPSVLLTQSDNLESCYVEVKDRPMLDWIRVVLTKTGHFRDRSTPCFCMQKATVKSVHRIENFRLWHRYQARLAAMREDHAKYNVSVQHTDLELDFSIPSGVMTRSQSYLSCGEPMASDVQEKILLHGTSWENADAIVMDGFDHRTCARGMYGDGVYFAGAACKCHQYTCQTHSGKACSCKHERTLIIARVALGDAFHASQTRKGERRPPNRDGATGTHGSVVVNPGPIHGHHNPNQIHQEFVIFDREQAYPAFVVQYVL